MILIARNNTIPYHEYINEESVGRQEEASLFKRGKRGQ
jgi:hypothetical protein